MAYGWCDLYRFACDGILFLGLFTGAGSILDG